MAILLIAEHDNQNLIPSTLNAMTAARALGREVDVLVAGSNCQTVAEQAAVISGVKRVLQADSEAYANALPENVSALVTELSSGYSYILAAASTTGKDIMPRVAALLDVGQLSEIISVESEDTFKRPIYAGNAIATVQSVDPVKVITVRTSAFDKAESTGGNATIETISSNHDAGTSAFIRDEIAESDRPDLGSAKVIVSGGRGVGSGENFAIIEQLADKLGAAVGASRAAVDAGFVSNDLQVGQTGKIVAPELYIAVGISGAIQHLAGMKDSKVIVAINKDVEAPIFQIADYGLEADLFDVVPELAEKL